VRKGSSSNSCCIDPVDVVVRSGTTEIFKVAACRSVVIACTHRHGHGAMDSRLRILNGSPPEVVVVEGGCEERAIMHGYVPPGVAAWSGCNHKRYRWDGKAMAPVK
jgi:hypothetical protein